MSRHLTALADYKSRLLRRLSNYHPELSAVETVKLPWFRVQNVTDDPTAMDVYIYDEIGGSFGVDANELVQEINASTADAIDVHINSPGGDLFDSISIYNALYKHPANVTVYVDSLAASGASIITMSGDKRVMMPGSQLMIHDALAVLVGNAADFRSMATFLDRQSDNIADIYSMRAGGKPEEHRTRMLAETWMFASESVEMGYADEVYTRPADASEEDDTVPADATNQAPDVLQEQDLVDLFNLMTKRHNMRNRGFKYPGREAAPAPQVEVSAAAIEDAQRFVKAVVESDNYAKMADLLRERLSA